MGLFDKLNIIRDIDEINTGASAEEIQAFALRVKHNCRIDLPEDYLEFLSLCDGFDFNGYCIYGTTDDIDSHLNMIEANFLFHKNDSLKRYWFYGTGSLSWYVLDTETNSYLDMDASEDVIASFKTFGELVEHILIESVGE